MRLLAASLIAGGCLLTASTVSAEALKLDDTALDQVTAGVEGFRTIDERRALLIAAAARDIADGIEDAKGDPIVGAAFDFLIDLANQLDPPPADNGDGGGDDNGFGILPFPTIPAIPPIAMF